MNNPIPRAGFATLESNKESAQRIRQKGARPPLRTNYELADEFGISLRDFHLALIQDLNAPSPKLKGSFNQGANKLWYDYKAVRSWWKARHSK
jgi:hypothetical protein